MAMSPALRRLAALAALVGIGVLGQRAVGATPSSPGGDRSSAHVQLVADAAVSAAVEERVGDDANVASSPLATTVARTAYTDTRRASAVSAGVVRHAGPSQALPPLAPRPPPIDARS